MNRKKRPSFAWHAAACAVVLPIGLSAGCSPALVPISKSQHDPSNPHVPEGAPATFVVATAVDQHEVHHHEENAAEDAGSIYVCPMHPEVTSNAPGSCPKCKMKLVPKK